MGSRSRSRSQGAGAGLFWSEPEPEPEPKKFGRLRLRTRCRYSDDFFGNLNFKFSKNFKIFSKIDRFQIDFQKDPKIGRNYITNNFFDLMYRSKKFSFPEPKWSRSWSCQIVVWLINCFVFVCGSLACWSRLDYGLLVLAWMLLYANSQFKNFKSQMMVILRYCHLLNRLDIGNFRL